MELIERRKALADALSAHDVEAVRSYLHPLFVIRGADGVAIMDRTGLQRRLPAFFEVHPEYKQSVQIEASNVQGDDATLQTRRDELLHVLWWPHSVTSHWIETWKKLNGQWLLVEETPNP